MVHSIPFWFETVHTVFVMYFVYIGFYGTPQKNKAGQIIIKSIMERGCVKSPPFYRNPKLICNQRYYKCRTAIIANKAIWRMNSSLSSDRPNVLPFPSFPQGNYRYLSLPWPYNSILKCGHAILIFMGMFLYVNIVSIYSFLRVSNNGWRYGCWDFIIQVFVFTVTKSSFSKAARFLQKSCCTFLPARVFCYHNQGKTPHWKKN